MATSTQTPAIATDADGRTHIVWNQNGVIYHAYYNPVGDQWVEAAPIAESTSSTEIQISTDVATGRVGDTSNSDIIVFWLEGEGNETEIKKIQGTLNDLGQLKWTPKQTVSNDLVHDENMDMVTTADGNILLISEKVDLDDPEADKDLYTQIVDLKNNQPIYNNLVHFSPVTTDSFRLQNNPVLPETSGEVEEQELLPGTFLFTIINEIGWEHPLSFIKEVAIKNVLSYGGGTGLAKEEESKNVLAYLMARDDLSVSLVLGEYAEVMAQGRAEGKVNLEFGLNEGGSTLSASDAFRFLFQTDLNLLPLLGIPPLEVGNTGIELQAGIILGVSFTLKQEWEVADFDFPPEPEESKGKVGDKSSTATAAENSSSDYWYTLVRADGTPAQVGDDPSQLYWLINKDEAMDNFFAPPEGTTVGGPLTEGTNTGSIGLTAGIFGKAKLEAGGRSLLDLGADLSITANFEVFPEQQFTSLSELLTLDIGLFGFGTEKEIEGEQNFGSEELFGGMEADFIKGSSAVYADNPLDGNKIADNLTDDSSPDMVTAENGDIYAVWISDTHNINDLSHVLVSKSVDGGDTWNPSWEIPNSQGMNFDPVIGITNSGQMLVAWSNGSADIFYDDQEDQDNDGKADVDPDKLDQALAETTLYYSISNDGGTTWTEGTPVLPGIKTPQKMSLSQMSNGQLLLTWFVADDDNDAIPEDKLYSSFWNGSTWSQSLLVATGDIQLLETPAAATVGGNPTIFWTETSSTDPNSAPDKVNIYYSVYSQQYNNWLSSPILFSPDVSNLARFQDNPEVLVVGNNNNNQNQLSQGYNSIVGERDVSLVIPNLQGTGASELHVAPVSVQENDKKAVVVVYRSGDLNEKVSFNYKTLDSSATAGADYVAKSGTLTFAPGEVVKKITIPLLDDLIGEKRAEKFRVMITSDHPNAHHLIDGLQLEKGQIELIATVIVQENEPTNLSEIDSGFILEADKEAQTGMAVVPAGDIDGNGINDFLVGAPAKNRKLNDQDDTLEGAVYVVYGQSNIGITDQKLSLDSLNGTNGLIIWGPENSRLGTSLATADFDGDGKNDLILGAPENPVTTNGGTVYVLPGSSINKQAEMDLGSVPALKLQSTLPGNNAGYKVAVGNVNGDSIADLVISAPATNKVYVVYGNAVKNNLKSNTTLNLDNLGTNGFVISSDTGALGTGLDLADVNHDGVDDLLLGSPQSNPVDYSKSPDAESKPPLYGGQVYVVFGSQNLNSQINLNQLNGSNGFVLKGQAFYNPPNQDGSTPIDPNLQPDSTIADSAGTNVVNLGDINGDQIEDWIISAADSSVAGIQARGRAYVVFGKASGWSSSIDLTTLNGSNGFIINGIYDPNHNLGGNTGYSISAVGDVNKDGFNDLLISAPTLSTNGDNSATGQSYLILGSTTQINNGILDLSDPQTLENRVFLFNNPNQGSQLGFGLGSVGDINGDESPDLALATPQVYPNKETSEVYMAFGHPWMGAGGSIDVNKLRSDNGFVFQPPTNNQLGTVRLGGDINGDGYTDTLIADAGFNGLGGKIAYLFFGSDPLQPTTFSQSIPITLSGSDGLIQGIQSLDSGDFNHDGIADLAIGRSGDSQNSYATIIFGRQDSSFWSDIDPSKGIDINDLLSKNGGVKVNVSNISNQGEMVSVAGGDFNGDGSDDLLINSSNLNPFIIFGQNNWQRGTVSSVSVPSQSLVIKPEVEQSIVSVNSLGDVNGDGYIDFGLMSVTENQNSVYVVFGKKTLAPNSALDLANLNGTNGFKITDPGDGEAASISSVGDFNGDGLGDFAICFGDVVEQGVKNLTYILFGSLQIGNNGTFNLSQIGGKNGFVVSSSQSQVYTVTGGGDVNGDGYDELVVGAPGGEDSSNKGNVYTIYGNADTDTLPGGTFDLSSLDNSTNGFVALGAQPNSFAGYSLGGIEDVNGDGYADLGIGAAGDNNNSVSGLGYNVFGYGIEGVTEGTLDNDILSPPDVATPSNPHLLNGKQGNDVLQSVGVDPDSGEKGRIVMNGGQGNDLLSIGSLKFDRLDGGSGDDTLQLNSYVLSSNNLDLTDTIQSSRIHGIENIDLGSGNRVTLNLQTLTGLSDTTNTFKILGHGSLVVASDYQNWIKQQPFTDQATGISYDVYLNQGTRLLIQQSHKKNTFMSTTKVQLSVYGTNNNDQLGLGSPEHFTGKGNIVFAQGGHDLVDLTSSSGSNQVYGGTGDDTLIPGINDLLYGGAGNDMLISSNSQGGNTIEGEKGNDTFYLGQNEQAFGGEGNDRFFMEGKGKNIVFGGPGKDEYWIADEDFPPSFNAIMDFESGQDTIGLKDLASRQDEVKLTQYGHDVLISLGNQYLARVQNVFLPFLKVSLDNQDLLIQAEEPVPIKVVNNYDSGTGSLRQALMDAGSSSHPGPDIIDLTSIGSKTILLNSPLPTITTGNDLVLQTAGVLGSPTIKASSTAYQNIFTINGANVSLSYLNLVGGFAKGGDGVTGGGGGLGAGGALTILDNSTVIVDNVTFTGNQAQGGNGSKGPDGSDGKWTGTPHNPKNGGGGGNFNASGQGSAGGEAGSVKDNNPGGDGDDGESGGFGVGGGGGGGGGGGSGPTGDPSGGDGGWGGDGGFGAGGGAGAGGGGNAFNDPDDDGIYHPGFGGYGGDGDFAGADGSNGKQGDKGLNGDGGDGGTGGDGASLGGAFFAYGAHVTITNSFFNNNKTVATSGSIKGKALGGGIFINTNASALGKIQSMLGRAIGFLGLLEMTFWIAQMPKVIDLPAGQEMIVSTLVLEGVPLVEMEMINSLSKMGVIT